MFSRSSFLQTVNQRRDSICIVSEILSCAEKGAGKTEIIYKVGLSSAQINKYLLLLLKSELLTIYNHEKRTRTKSAYKTTAKGKSFLETFDTLTDYLLRPTSDTLTYL